MSDELRQISLQVDTDRGTSKDFSGGRIRSVVVVNGDTVLFAFRFQRIDSTTGDLVNMDLTAGGNPQAIRFTCREDRDPSDALLTFQDVYNQGDLPTFEDLTKGQVTFRVSFNDPDIDALLATVDTVGVWIECTILSFGGIPQTLLQKQITINQEIDDGAAGTPPPTSPTYLTANEVAASYTNRDRLAAWAVIDKDLTTPPASPSNGDTYIVAAGATGAWAGQDGNIAYYYGGTWYFHAAIEGWRAYAQDENKAYWYTGSAWSATANPNTVTLEQARTANNVLAGDVDMNSAGKILNLSAPTAGGDATNKTYVDARTLEQVRTAGNQIAGDIDANNVGKLINLPAPTASGDAVRKSYVDTQFTKILGGAGFTVNAESSDTITVNVQLKDLLDADVAAVTVVRMYLSDSSDGVGLTATAPSGGVAAGTDGTILTEDVTDKMFTVISESDGDIDLVLTEVGVATWYLVAILATGRIAVSAAITFA
jgi:hypothetical protein